MFTKNLHLMSLRKREFKKKKKKERKKNEFCKNLCYMICVLRIILRQDKMLVMFFFVYSYTVRANIK